MVAPVAPKKQSLGDFFGSYWWNQNRIINRHPANGEYPREQTCDLNLLVQQHPAYDEFWRERSPYWKLADIKVPVLSIGHWGLGTLGHLAGADGTSADSG